MEISSDANPLLDPNFILLLYSKFGKCNQVVPKIKLIIEEFRKIDTKPSSSTTPSISKNNLKSIELYEEAERFSRNRDDVFALARLLELYNESICYAEQGDNEHLANLYASRASVYFKLKKYECCLENIVLAKADGKLTEDNVHRLNELKAESLELSRISTKIQKESESNVRIQLHVEANPQIPFAAGCLELTTDTTGGRYIVTNEDIDPGSIIVIESPFETVLSNCCIYQRCSNCLKENSLNLIPCLNCTKAMFCSEKCKREAFESFHRFECPIIDCLIDVGGQITIRTFFKAIQSFNSMRELIEFIDSMDVNHTAFSFDHSNGLSPQQRYHQIHSLSTNHHIRPELDLFTHVMVTALFYYQLSVHSPFKDIIIIDEEKECSDSLIELMFRIELITTINSFNFNDMSSPYKDRIIGTGIYPFSSLINHSCSPNACTKYHNNDLVLYTTQPIKQGESIAISYNGSHVFLPKDKRQSFLNEKYHFLCQCIACTNDFPLLYNMALANIPEIHSHGMNVQLDRTNSENVYAKCCAYLREHHHNYPCREIYSVQMCLSKLLQCLLMNDDKCPVVELCIGKLGNVNPNDIVLNGSISTV